jgi:hypothetical protein
MSRDWNDNRRVLDWWLDLLHTLIQCLTTFYSSLLRTLVSTVKFSLSLLGSGFQRWTFPLLSVPELSPASATSFSQQQLTTTETQHSLTATPSQSRRYVTTDGQSASLSWCQAPIWGPCSEIYYCQTVAGSLMLDALSEERTGCLQLLLAFTSAVIFGSQSRGTHDP